jgi:hypothetical protein
MQQFAFVPYINLMLPHALCSSLYRGSISSSDHAQANFATYSVDNGGYFPTQMPPRVLKVKIRGVLPTGSS